MENSRRKIVYKTFSCFRWATKADAQVYKHWSEIAGASVPSQTLAVNQLRARFLNDVPVLVCFLAPAGFGKSELIKWVLCFGRLHHQHWETIAVTGVAATQVGGHTVLGKCQPKK